MKLFFIVVSLFVSLLSFSQEKDLALQESNNLVYEGNELIADNEFVSAEMEYRKAISKKPSNAIANYDLGNAYYTNGKYEEALIRHAEAEEFAETKEQKHKAWHNIGNTLMKAEKCPEAVEAFKNALRNNPTDDETRYNLGLAKECAKNQGGGGDDDDKKDEDKNKDEKDGENENEKDEGEQEQKDDKGNEDQENEGDDKKDEDGDPKDEKEDKNNDGKPEDQKKQPQPQQAKLSPQQIKNLLEAMNNQEQKVQEKINAKKTKGVKVKTDKDW